MKTASSTMVKMKAMKATASNTIQKMKAMKTMTKPASSMTPKKTKALSKSANQKPAHIMPTVKCQPGHFPDESASAQANAARRTWSDAHFEIPAGVDRQMPIFGFTLFSGSQ